MLQSIYSGHLSNYGSIIFEKLVLTGSVGWLVLIFKVVQNHNLRKKFEINEKI